MADDDGKSLPPQTIPPRPKDLAEALRRVESRSLELHHHVSRLSSDVQDVRSDHDRDILSLSGKVDALILDVRELKRHHYQARKQLDSLSSETEDTGQFLTAIKQERANRSKVICTFVLAVVGALGVGLTGAAIADCHAHLGK